MKFKRINKTEKKGGLSVRELGWLIVKPRNINDDKNKNHQINTSSDYNRLSKLEN